MPLEITLSSWLLINKIIIVLTNIIGFWLALTSFFTNRSQKISKLYAYLAICLIVWIDLRFLVFFAPLLFPMPVNFQVALWGTRLIYAVLSLFFVAAYYFSIHFPREKKRIPVFDTIYTAIWAILFLLAPTPFMIDQVVTPQLITGDGAPVYYYAMIVSAVICLYNIFSKNHYLTSEEKMKVQDFLRGIIIFGAFEAIPLQKIAYGEIFGHYSFIFMLGFLAYAINRKEIFEIKVILVELLLGAIGTILIILPFMTESIWLKLAHYILFILFCIFFDVIMKSILKEFREKELLEQKVEQRTEELESAKKNLEEANAVLEVRVRARTLELERLNQTLEEKVEERTNDLQEKMRELERFNRLSVGRELKMIELKNRIKDMERKAPPFEKAGKSDRGVKKNKEEKTRLAPAPETQAPAPQRLGANPELLPGA